MAFSPSEVDPLGRDRHGALTRAQKGGKADARGHVLYMISPSITPSTVAGSSIR